MRANCGGVVTFRSPVLRMVLSFIKINCAADVSAGDNSPVCVDSLDDKVAK